MKRLLSNKGNLLFTTAICLVVAMLGFSILMLVTTSKERSTSYSNSLYQRYTYESLGRVAVNEVFMNISSVKCSTQYSPLAESQNIQLQLQETLIDSYLDEQGKWKYCDLIPAAVTSKKIDIHLDILNLNTIIENDLDLLQTQVIIVPEITLEMTFDNYSFTATISNLRLIYTLEQNRVYCRYNTDDATVFCNGLAST